MILLEMRYTYFQITMKYYYLGYKGNRENKE